MWHLANTRPLSISAIDQTQQDSKNPSAAQEEGDKKGMSVTTANIFIWNHLFNLLPPSQLQLNNTDMMVIKLVFINVSRT